MSRFHSSADFIIDTCAWRRDDDLTYRAHTLRGEPFETTGASVTTYDLEHDCVRPTQRATYKFFALAIFLFVCQILPRLAKVPSRQKFLLNLLFVLCLITGVGSLAGIYPG